MKSKLTLAVLIAATLALGACSKAPKPRAATGPANAMQASPVASAGPATRGVIGETTRTIAIGVTEAHAYKIPEMVAWHDLRALGVTNAFAFFRAERAGDLKVTAAAGEPGVSVGFPGTNLARGLDPAKGIHLQAGWHRVDIECLSDRCSDVTATFNGKPIVPYAWPYPAVTGFLQ